MKLKDKVIIVTGSTTGIGRAIARRCVEDGAFVVVHGRHPARGRKVVEELGPRATLHLDDLADPEAPRRIVSRAVGAYGGLHAVVNNAAKIERSTIETTGGELFDEILAVNVRAPLLLIRESLPYLEKTKGCVLNIGSINGYCGEETLLAYSISKGGLMTLSRNLGDALHLRHGIRVVHFNVGWVLTENEYEVKIRDGLPSDWPKKVPKAFAPSGRIMMPAEIARAAAYWLSDDAPPVSGSVIDLEQFPVIGRNPPKEV